LDVATGEGKATFYGTKPDNHVHLHWLAYSPDGKYVVVYDGGGKLYFRDPATGAVRIEIDPEITPGSAAAAVNGGCFSPKSDYFVLVAGNTIRFWSLPDGKLLDRFANVQPNEQDKYPSVFIPPDGTVLITGVYRRSATGGFPVLGIAGMDCFDEVWDLVGNRPARQLQRHDQALTCASSLSSDGKVLMSLSPTRIDLLDWEADRFVATLTSTTGVGGSGFRWAALTPDGTAVIAGCHDGMVRRWDVRDGVESGRFQAGQPKDSIAGLSVAPDGKLLATAVDDMLTVWQTDEAFAKK
jgi:WD40 repeat protein